MTFIRSSFLKPKNSYTQSHLLIPFSLYISISSIAAGRRITKFNMSDGTVIIVGQNSPRFSLKVALKAKGNAGLPALRRDESCRKVLINAALDFVCPLILAPPLSPIHSSL